jgi:large subunit ribosomal protein L25
MAEITLVAEPGRTTGTAHSKRLRTAGRIPAVVYGGGIEATAVSVDARELRHALSGEAGVNQLLNLEVGSTRHLTLARIIQRHPVRGTVVHVDFQVVRRDEVITAEVPIVTTGEAKAVEQESGVVEQVLNALTVHALPTDIPNEIVVDISELTVGESIRVSDLRLPSGVSTEVDPEEPVVSTSYSAVAAEAEEMAEAEAAAAEEPEGETLEGDAAGGDAPSGGDGAPEEG